MTTKTCNTGGLEVTTPYFPRTKPFIGEKSNARAVTSTEAGPSNPIRAQLAAFGSRQNQVHEVDDGDDEDDIQEIEASMDIPRGNGKRKETHAVENEVDDEIQEVDPPPPKMTRSRGGSQKPSSTVNGKPTNGVAKGKAKAKAKLGSTKPATKLAQEPMDVDMNDVVEHDVNMGVNGTAAIANNINAAIKHNAGRAPKVQSGQQNDDGPMEELRQVRFIGKTLLVVLIE